MMSLGKYHKLIYDYTNMRYIYLHFALLKFYAHIFSLVLLITVSNLTEFYLLI